MPRTSFTSKLLAACLLAHAGAVFAQTTPPSDAPPKLERVEEGSDAPITIVPKRDDSRKIKETRDGGRVKEVEVRSGRSVYKMKGAAPGGSVAANAEGTGSTLRPPQWQVLEFDLSRKKQSEREAEAAEAAAAAAAPAPPPPPPPASK